MARDMSAMLSNALEESELRPILFFEGEFASGWVRIWSGWGDLDWNDRRWTGVGSLFG